MQKVPPKHEEELYIREWQSTAKLPRETVDTPSSEIFQIHQDMFLYMYESYLQFWHICPRGYLNFVVSICQNHAGFCPAMKWLENYDTLSTQLHRLQKYLDRWHDRYVFLERPVNSIFYFISCALATLNKLKKKTKKQHNKNFKRDSMQTWQHCSIQNLLPLCCLFPKLQMKHKIILVRR